ncbi:MAG: sigma-70 family RNA polymerase sigma factor [Candidatus Krumholzibacteriota bacterium]
MHADAKYPDEAAFYAAAIAAYVAGDSIAGDELSTALAGPLRLEVRIFLGDDNADVDDVVQDSIMAVLHYLRKNEGFTGNLVKFAVTVARNRCRNLLNWRQRLPHVQVDPMLTWLENSDRSPLDALLDREITEILQEALDRLSEDCQVILRAFYLEDVPVEEIRRRTGLKTVQGIYYRKMICLEQAFCRLKNRLNICSSGGNRGSMNDDSI